MLLPISKFCELLKDPINPEEELVFSWDNGKLNEVKTKKKFF